MDNLNSIETQLEPLKQTLLDHPVYSRVRDLASLRIFMEHHVFAVWDFMSLLKHLQQEWSSVAIPWVPSRSVEATRLINEIVLGEESDIDQNGNFTSHFELYVQAMKQCGANTDCIETFLSCVSAGQQLEEALSHSRAPAGSVAFVSSTFRVLEQRSSAQVTSNFTLGREQLLPDVFRKLVTNLNQAHHGQLDLFTYYLSRHIEVDEDNHGPMARNLLKITCGSDPNRWAEAERAAVDCLHSRISLWDSILHELSV
ncbi:MAG: DUF3050 domain-containing protein [Planctomycetota bacterium]|nr:DUF3050 domain-containing protein [Planctomycetota bacterium]